MKHNRKELASNDEAVPQFPARPFQVLTLLDMLEFLAYSYYLFISKFEGVVCLFKGAEWKRGNQSPANDEELGKLREEMTLLAEELNRVGVTLFQVTLNRIKELREDCDDPPLIVGVVNKQLMRLRQDLERDLREYVFMSLSAEEVTYYNQEQLFGSEVFQNFPNMRHDVVEAGNCYATGRYTASVFHCMRVVERGLHAFALDLNSRFNANVNFGDKDIRYVNWGNILEKIEKEIELLLRPDRKPRLTRNDLQFYSDAAKEFVYIKILWRDDVSHSRSEYDQPMAKSVMDHVKAFMTTLSKHGLTEK